MLKKGLLLMKEKVIAIGISLWQRIIKGYEWLDQSLILPVYKKIIHWLTLQCDRKIKKYGLLSKERKDGLKSFEHWLSGIPDEQDDVPETQPGAQPKIQNDICDLYTLMTEFAGLRQEIRFQNREQAKSTKSVTQFIDDYNTTAVLLKRSTIELQNMEKTIVRLTENKVLTPFFEVRDSLLRGSASIRKMKAASGFIKRRKIDFETLIEGYEIAIRRFDRAVALAGIFPVDTVGKPFNPKTMKAISVKPKEQIAKRRSVKRGDVVEQACCGFRKGDQVLKFAEVVVAE